MLPINAEPPPAAVRRPGSVRSGVLAWVVILVGCAWMVTNGFGLLADDEPSDPGAVDTASVQISPQVDAAVRLVVAVGAWTGADALDAGVSSLEPMAEKGVLEQLAYAITARWMGDLPLSRSVMEAAVGANPDDATVRAVQACLAAADARASEQEPGALPVGVTRESIAPLGVAGQMLESMATGNGALGDQLRQRAQLVAIGFAAFLGIVALAFLAGVATLVWVAINASAGRIHSRLAPTLERSNAIHLELFAAWVGYEVVLQLLAGWLGLHGSGTGMVITLQALGLVAVAWPICRGLPWGELRRELGLTAGAGWLREVAWGVLAWCMAVPMVAVGVLIALVLAAVTGDSLGNATHPLQEGLRSSDSTGIVLWYLIAAVVAPFLEELVFRGGLYRGIRSGTANMPLLASMVVSALLSSLVFAGIHPQGVLFIPILGALAMSFCLARELRGSLIAPMVGHALNNGLIVTLNLALLG